MADLTGGHIGRILCIALDKTKVISCGEDYVCIFLDFSPLSSLLFMMVSCSEYAFGISPPGLIRVLFVCLDINWQFGCTMLLLSYRNTWPVNGMITAKYDEVRNELWPQEL